MIHTTPELLAPAGGQEQLEAAILYGAGAIYLGSAELSLRGACQGFNLESLRKTIDWVHSKGAKVYYCLNVLPQNNYLSQIIETLQELRLVQPDALIVADPGVLYLAKQHCPNLPLHLSTQAHSCNSAAVHFWQDAGIKRINLARELNLKAIRQLVKAHPDMEFEAFTHGALCLALSGHCLMSEWVNQRHANMGLCTQPCRFNYREMASTDVEPYIEEAHKPDVFSSLEGEESTLPQHTWAVEESTRPGSPIFEAKLHNNPNAGVFSSIWAPHDQALMRHLAWFSRLGVQALKIEGRTKSAGYVAQVVDAYRTGLNLISSPDYRQKIKELQTELVNISSRPLSTGFFLPGRRQVLGKPQRTQIIVARVEEIMQDNRYRLSVRYRWQANQELQLMIPGQKQNMPAGSYGLENHKGVQVDTLHSGMSGYLRAEVKLEEGYFLRIIAG